MKADRLSEMQKAELKITADRGWEKFHLPKNLAMDLVREAAEVMEHVIWETNEEIKNDPKRIRQIEKEMADVLHALLLLADSLGSDLVTVFWEKLREIEKRYPASQVYGRSGYAYKHRKKSTL